MHGQVGKASVAYPVALAVILLAAAACGNEATPGDDAPSDGEVRAGSGPSETATASSDSATARTPSGDYLAICGLAGRAFEDAFEEPFDLQELAARLGDVVEQFESVQPPEEFADWHEATAAYLRAIVAVVDDASGPGEGASREQAEDYALRIMGPVAFQHLPAIFEVVEGMDPDDIARMVEAGCVDEADISAALVGEERREPGTEDGDGIDGVATAEFVSVSAGHYHSCGVRTDRTVSCWGRDDEGQSTPPDGAFASVSAGRFHSCGVRTDGTIECWGGHEEGLPDEPFASVSVGSFHACGVRTDGKIACWGFDSEGEAAPPDGEFVSVSAGAAHTCGIRSDGRVACWGNDNLGQAAPPDGHFVSVSAGGAHTCGVRTDGTVECWGYENPVGFTPLGGSFVSISSGMAHACAVMTDGSVGCWGAGASSGEKLRPPSGSFASVSAGESHTCGVRSGGSVACWGSDEFGQATLPGGGPP